MSRSCTDGVGMTSSLPTVNVIQGSWWFHWFDQLQIILCLGCVELKWVGAHAHRYVFDARRLVLLQLLQHPSYDRVMSVGCDGLRQQTKWVRLMKYDVTQMSTQSARPYDVSRQVAGVIDRVECCYVSSSRVSKARSALSSARSISARTSRTAVSGEWWARYVVCSAAWTTLTGLTQNNSGRRSDRSVGELEPLCNAALAGLLFATPAFPIYSDAIL